MDHLLELWLTSIPQFPVAFAGITAAIGAVLLKEWLWPRAAGLLDEGSRLSHRAQWAIVLFWAFAAFTVVLWLKLPRA